MAHDDQFMGTLRMTTRNLQNLLGYLENREEFAATEIICGHSGSMRVGRESWSGRAHKTGGDEAHEIMEAMGASGSLRRKQSSRDGLGSE